MSKTLIGSKAFATRSILIDTPVATIIINTIFLNLITQNDNTFLVHV